MEPEILFEDNHILVVYKPEGLATETAKITEEDLNSYLKKKLPRATYLATIHRLDQPVEGLLVFAKTPFASKELSCQVQENQMKKRYLAAVSMDEPPYGNEEENERVVQEGVQPARTLEDFLLKDGRTNTSKVVEKETKGAKRAALRYRLVQANYQEGIALMEVELLTGRHHQIRVQMAHANMPLLGDVKYGNEVSREKSKRLQVKQTALCAHQLEFIHPKTKKPLSFQISPKKEIFQKFSIEVRKN